MPENISYQNDDDTDMLSIGELKNLYTSSSKSFSANEIEQLMDRCYVTNSSYQLSSADLAELRKRHMPALTMNYCEKLKRSMIGIIESNPIDPIAIPQNPQSQNGADIATKLVRYLLRKNNMDTVRIDLASDFIVEGVCATILDVDVHTNKRTNKTTYRPSVKRVSPYDFFYDPSSKERDFKDATYLGIRKWISENQLETLYPEKYEELGSPLMDETFLSTSDYTDTTAIELIDRKNRKVCLIELYELSNGNWNRYVFAANGIYDYDESPFVDTEGNSFCPISAISNIVDIKHNYRIGSIRRVRNSQDIINQVMIKVSAAINSRQVRQTDLASTVANPNDVRREASRVDGVIPFGYDLVSNSENVAGNMQVLQEQISFMLDSIPNANTQSTIQANNASGRSKLVDQQLGLIEYAELLKMFSSMEESMYKKIWFTITEYCTEDEIINVSGDPRAPEFINVNHVTGFEQVPVIDPQTGQPQFDDMGNIVTQTQPVIENSLIEMDLDFSFRQIPTTGSLRGEVFDSFVQLIQSGVQINSPEFEVLLELSPLEDKQEIRDDIAKWFGQPQQFDPQAAAAQAQAQQAQAAQQAQLQNLQIQAQIREGELRLAKMEADIQQVRSTTLKNIAAAHATTQDIEIEANSEAVQINHDIAESQLKEAKAKAINTEIEHSQMDQGLKLAGLNNILNS